MEVYYSNINMINEEIEEFVIAKNKIEKPLIEDEKIEKKMSIKEFLEYVNLSENTFINASEQISPIAFQIFSPSEDIFVIIYSSNISDNSLIEKFKNSLESIKYNISNLKHITQLDIINGKLDLNSSDYFIIKNEFYIIQ